MRRIGELLPEAASALGIEADLRRARAAVAWARIVGERVPAASGATALVEWREAEGLLAVSAAQPIVAQELRLRADQLLEAFGRSMGGRSPDRLQVVVRLNADADALARRPRPDVD